MFKLNGDIVRQLNLHFDFSFKEQYKNEIKTRLIDFINSHINSLYPLETFSNKYKVLSDFIEFENGEIKSIKKTYFDNIKQELFNSFNPLWYKTKTNKKNYLKKDLKKQLSLFILYKEEYFSNLSSKCLLFSSGSSLSPTTIFSSLNLGRTYSNETYDNNFNETLINHIEQEYMQPLFISFKSFHMRLDTFENNRIVDKINSYFDEEIKKQHLLPIYILKNMFSFNFSYRFITANQKLRDIPFNNLNLEQITLAIYYFNKLVLLLKEENA